MPQNREKVLDIIAKIAVGMNLSRKVDSVTYRADWQDYQVIMDEKFHCEIREKLIDVLLGAIEADDISMDDARREVEFRFKTAVEFEDWEQ